MFTPNQKLVQHRKGRGFTLIELLIVIVIVGILASLAIPSFSSFVAQQRIKTASFDVMAMLTLTRSEAIKRNAQVTATPANNDWAQGWTITVAASTVSQQNALRGIAVTCFAGNPLAAANCTAISYDPSGRSDKRAIQISGINTTGANTRCISIDPSGRPNSKKTNCP